MCFAFNRALTDHVAVQSGVKNETKTNGLRSAVDSAKAPRNFTGNDMTAKQKMIEIVGSCIDKTLKEYGDKPCDLSEKDTRMNIAMDTLDKILLILEKPNYYGPGDPGDEHQPKEQK